jgi:phosphoglycolate phosphatase
VRPSSGVAFEHVAFDLDGTLLDTRSDLAAAVNHVLRSLGLGEQAPETLYGYVGEGARLLVERALGPERRALFDEAVARFLAHYAEHLLDATVPYPGMVDVLDVLAAERVAASVLTNKPIALTRAILDGLGFGPRFVDVVGGDSLPTRKPHPAGLERLRRRTGTRPERMLLVGDSDIDVATARAGGVPFCGVAWGLAPHRLVAAAPPRIVHDAAELLAVVRRGL